ncbi:hypothetical protein H6G74_07355 [Nostoc spongiaeforme FACHB-130]|uniref:Uncharacterized protein n=1 Tax=Nostoc spongiaeforme FACHB-130 TaxID=1357510 RepID=A0ABR8FV75_9NOSO|nr:hypothetical protein [Nostoc spongiaeforme FACHB-130]
MGINLDFSQERNPGGWEVWEVWEDGEEIFPPTLPSLPTLPTLPTHYSPNLITFP